MAWVKDVSKLLQLKQEHPKLQQVLRQVVRGILGLLGQALKVMGPYLEAVAVQRVLEQALEQVETWAGPAQSAAGRHQAGAGADRAHTLPQHRCRDALAMSLQHLPPHPHPKAGPQGSKPGQNSWVQNRALGPGPREGGWLMSDEPGPVLTLTRPRAARRQHRHGAPHGHPGAGAGSAQPGR